MQTPHAYQLLWATELRAPQRPERSDCFQGCFASREQIQVQNDFPQHRIRAWFVAAWAEPGAQES
jgi:hypothetical protein